MILKTSEEYLLNSKKLITELIKDCTNKKNRQLIKFPTLEIDSDNFLFLLSLMWCHKHQIILVSFAPLCFAYMSRLKYPSLLISRDERLVRRIIVYRQHQILQLRGNHKMSLVEMQLGKMLE